MRLKAQAGGSSSYPGAPGMTQASDADIGPGLGWRTAGVTWAAFRWGGKINF